MSGDRPVKVNILFKSGKVYTTEVSSWENLKNYCISSYKDTNLVFDFDEVALIERLK
jgi:hypothetical protein